MCKFCETYNFGAIGYNFPDYCGGRAGAIYFTGYLGGAPESDRFKFCPACGRPLNEEDFKPVLFLNFEGRDSWSRPVYEAGGRLYVDTDPREGREPRIATKYGNAFDGEPDNPVTGRFVFLPKRDTWN